MKIYSRIITRRDIHDYREGGSVMTATEMLVGRKHWIEYECRDIGYGVEEGYEAFTYAGREAWPGKLILWPVEGGETIYLFEDEILSAELVA